MQSIYEEVFSLEKSQVEKMKQDVIDKYHIASDIFPDAAEEDRQFLQTFSFICLLSFDVYVKKMMIEHRRPFEKGTGKKTQRLMHVKSPAKPDALPEILLFLICFPDLPAPSVGIPCHIRRYHNSGIGSRG